MLWQLKAGRRRPPGTRRARRADSMMPGLERAAAVAGVCIGLGLALATTAGDAAEAPPRSVVIIGQEDPILPWNIAVATVSRALANPDSGKRVVIYAEDLDFGRFGGERYRRQLQSHFA